MLVLLLFAAQALLSALAVTPAVIAGLAVSQLLLLLLTTLLVRGLFERRRR